MRTLIQIIAIILLGYLAETFLPWYSVAFVAFVAGYAIPAKSNFVGGFLGVAALWGIKIFKITSVAGSDLATRVAVIFPVEEVWILITITLLLGGLVGGFASLTGGLLRPRRKKSYY